MKALVFHGPNQMAIEDVPRPRPGPGEVLVEVRATGICGSDVHGYTGASGRRTPGMVMGHEFAGVIREPGEGVREPAEGTRVAVNPLLYCGECRDCRAGHEELCRNRRVIGVNTGLNGAFSELVVAPARNCIPLADEVSFAEGAMAEPLAVALRATNVAEPRAGEPLAILGGGTIGLCALLMCLMRGATPVFVTEMKERNRAIVARIGGVPLDAATADLLSVGREATGGRGFQRIVDAVAYSSTIAQALPALAPGGVLMLVGLARATVEVPLYDLVPQERIVKSSYAYSASEYRQVVEMLNTRQVDVGPLLEGKCSLAEAHSVFEQLASGERDLVKVVVEF